MAIQRTGNLQKSAAQQIAMTLVLMNSPLFLLFRYIEIIMCKLPISSNLGSDSRVGHEKDQGNVHSIRFYIVHCLLTPAKENKVSSVYSKQESTYDRHVEAPEGEPV